MDFLPEINNNYVEIYSKLDDLRIEDFMVYNQDFFNFCTELINTKITGDLDPDSFPNLIKFGEEYDVAVPTLYSKHTEYASNILIILR